MSADAKLAELKDELPPAPTPAGTYSPVVQFDRTLYVSGHGPLLPDGTMIKGKVGADLSEAEGIRAARQVGLAMLSTVSAHVGSLDKVGGVLKVLGMVNAAPNFENHPKVINGFSDLMVAVFGEKGRAARSAVGMGSLPMNIAVEVEAIFWLKS